MKKEYTLLMILLFLSLAFMPKLHSQGIKRFRGKYFIENEYYSKKEIKELLINNPNSNYYYSLYVKQRSKSSALMLIGLGVFGATSIYEAFNEEVTYDSPFLEGYGYTLIGLLIGVVIEFSSMVYSSNAASCYDRSIEVFNDSEYKQSSVPEMKISLGIREHGIGVTLFF